MKVLNISNIFLITVLVISIAIVLIAGLIPHANYKNNWVDYNAIDGVTHFKKHGIATGHIDDNIIKIFNSGEINISLNVAFELSSSGNFMVLTQLDSPPHPASIIIGQWRSYLIIMNGKDFRNKLRLARLSVDLSKQMDKYIQISIEIRKTESRLLIDGDVADTGPPFIFSNIPKRISIGNTPEGSHGWQGKLKLIALNGIATGHSADITYRFDKSSLNSEILIDGDTSAYLEIPKPGKYPERQKGYQVISISDLLNHNKKDLLLNIFGLMPIGFLLLMFLRNNFKSSKITSHIFMVMFYGFLLSLSIEGVQIFIPGRNSHLHDLILNTIGVTIGVLLYLCFNKLRYTNKVQEYIE